MDKSTQLNDIKTAIQTILSGGQSYKIGTSSLTRADLSTLYEMQKQIENEIAEENAGGGLGRSSAAVYFDKR